MGSRLIKTETVIKAPAERVWAEMTDFGSFPSWNPFVREASGRLEPGEQLKIRLQLDRMKMTFKPRVTVVEPGRELRWLATLGRPGVFDVDRAFQIEPRDGGVLFVMSEECTGWLTPVMFATNLEAQLYRGYDAFNNALRRRVEGAG
ncbi:MAG TPA: SRPBCC domain-containing protein [Solirubrobacteraceae bacterium]|nr:SRPBCC domain-containing protein [Solirubrobacteraceae bacterium]